MNRALLFVLIPMVACSCTTTSPAQISDRSPYMDGSDLEGRNLPTHPKEMMIPESFDGPEWLIPLEKGACISRTGSLQANSPMPCPDRSGILISESRAARDGFFRIRYEELRKLYESDRSVWRAHRELYEKQLWLDEGRISEITPPPPSWWDKHGLSVIMGSSVSLGLLGGAALTVGVGYALYGTQPR